MENPEDRPKIDEYHKPLDRAFGRLIRASAGAISIESMCAYHASLQPPYSLEYFIDGIQTIERARAEHYAEVAERQEQRAQRRAAGKGSGGAISRG